jgi:hypothetical protein
MEPSPFDFGGENEKIIKTLKAHGGEEGQARRGRSRAD